MQMLPAHHPDVIDTLDRYERALYAALPPR
jgi:hypothetical protein